jgi:hypothetical protein
VQVGVSLLNLSSVLVQELRGPVDFSSSPMQAAMSFIPSERLIFISGGPSCLLAGQGSLGRGQSVRPLDHLLRRDSAVTDDHHPIVTPVATCDGMAESPNSGQRTRPFLGGKSISR